MHLSIERKAFSQVLRQGFRPDPVACHRKRKGRLGNRAQTRRSKPQSLGSWLPRFSSLAIGRLLKSEIRQVERPAFFVIRSNGGPHSLLRQVLSLAEMAAVRLGLGC